MTRIGEDGVGMQVMPDTRRPRSRYENELASLADAFDGARTPPGGLVEAMEAIGRRSVRFVGSGGSLTVARLAADLHKASTRAAAWATTPLLSVHEPAPPQSAFVLFSSGGKNPDAAVAVAAAKACGHDPVIMISQNRLADMPNRIQRLNPIVATVNAPRDGFLATGSVIATSTALIAAHGYELPDTDDIFAGHPLSVSLGNHHGGDTGEQAGHPLSVSLRNRIIVLYGWGLENVARDIETRLSELGLAAVQLADYRNFAHGRHVGLSRNQASTTVVALSDPTSQAIAERTLSELPREIDVVRLSSRFVWPASAVDLLVRSCRLPVSFNGSDPAKPEVPVFGRKLYHLPIARILKQDEVGPVDHKLAARGDRKDTACAAAALREWVEFARQQSIAALLLDYDGTCCTTSARFDPPSPDVQSGIIRALDIGLRLGFASGRGKSLPAMLREWLPEAYWPRVLLGLYNGSVLMRLDGSLKDQSEVPRPLRDIADALKSELADSASIEARTEQVNVRAGSGVEGADLLPVVRSVLARFGNGYKAYASGHSVDVIHSGHSKASLISELTESLLAEPAEVLAIGDSGNTDGNDFEMLAATRLSLSVDQVSPDLTRCWNLDARGEKGPALLVRYLSCLRRSAGKTRFVWKG